MPLKRDMAKVVRFTVMRKGQFKREPLEDAAELRVVFRDFDRVTGVLTIKESSIEYEPNTRGGARHIYRAAHGSFVNTLEELGDVQEQARREVRLARK